MRFLVLALLTGCAEATIEATEDPVVAEDAGPDDVDARRRDRVRDGEPDAALPDASSCGAVMTLGTGIAVYEPLEPGGTVHLYRGPQAGYMIYLSTRAHGLDPTDVRVCYVERFTQTGDAFGQGCWRVRMTRDLGDGWWERVGIWGTVDERFWATPAKIRGQAATIEVTMIDRTGCAAETTLDVVVSPDPGS